MYKSYYIAWYDLYLLKLNIYTSRPGREADHSPPSSADAKNDGSIPPLHHMSSWHSADLIQLRDNFTFFTYMWEVYS
jgi:hypothetical protein